MKIKQQQQERVALRLDADMRLWLEKKAKARRVSLSDILRELILTAMASDG